MDTQQIRQIQRLANYGRINKGREELPMDHVMALAPSVFATAPHADRSARYAYYPTSAIVEAMIAEGWAPVQAIECRTRREGHRGFQKHMVRFSRRDDLARPSVVGESRVDCLVINSHDGSSGYKIHAGIFRLVCSNGMVVSDGDFGQISVPHRGNQPAQVVEASMQVVRQIPELTGRVAELRALPLSTEERTAFAEAAAIVRWGSLEEAPIEPSALLSPRRHEDRGTDAWATLNVVQENLVNGGLRQQRQPGGRRLRTRAVESIDGNTALNKALWHLATALKR